jgi:hypothetical protein
MRDAFGHAYRVPPRPIRIASVLPLWIKIKNSAHPAIESAMLIGLSKRRAGWSR